MFNTARLVSQQTNTNKNATSFVLYEWENAVSVTVLFVCEMRAVVPADIFV